ncbi:hypothetical protein GTV32_16930 [Gordonia sp. SID5947]|uniref:DNA/RNA non-specific endonuclease n=1 Tax=Gordonia sp. SID5947 TaxID=2690315 RepID=UPI00136CA7A4|nr:DNA/RNA non-specific endonuclease [Gordonia sp. SID5947]MYR07877.1 hypothetical protein [Gordonia sp. SID5947]
MASLFAEPDQERLRRRLAAVTNGDLTGSEIKKLVAGDVSMIEDLAPTAKQKVAALVAPDHGLEALVGGSTPDFVPIAYLDLARMSAAAVARVIDGRRRPRGTGVMVSPKLFLTNHHVIEDESAAAEFSIQFDYQLGLDDLPEPVSEFRLAPSSFFWSSRVDELDVSLVAVGNRITGDRDLDRFGWTALSSAGDKHAEGDFVTVVQHPEGDFKQIALRENRVIGRGRKGTTLYYATDTLHGSSGSPVFNDEFDLVALHHSGGSHNDTELDDGRPLPPECNEGIRISAVVDTLRGVHDSLPAACRDLLAEALNPPRAAAAPDSRAPDLSAEPPVTGSGPTILTGDLRLPQLVITHDRAPTVGSLPPTALTMPALTVPAPAITTLGRASLSTAPPAADRQAPLERNDAPDGRYSARRGHDDDFLSVPVLPPRIPAALVKECAIPDGRRRSAANVLLRYHHFSLAVHARRRMPVFTIVDIDGRRLRSINRRTGEVESAEVWYADPRIAPDEQLDQSHFAAQHPRLFDRGHMVRRLDPAWGSPQTAKRSADDTFHFTNCCPQISAFNQHLWQGIENYALTNAAADKTRIVVITGPVLGVDDPQYRDVAVPREFWKIVVRTQDTRLRATAFLADQGDALDRALASGPESFDDLGAVDVFQTTVADLEKRSGLVFGPLRTADTMPTALESSAALDTLEEATW